MHIKPKTSVEAKIVGVQIERAYNILFQEMEKQGLLIRKDLLAIS